MQLAGRGLYDGLTESDLSSLGSPWKPGLKEWAGTRDRERAPLPSAFCTQEVCMPSMTLFSQGRLEVVRFLSQVSCPASARGGAHEGLESSVCGACCSEGDS